MRRMKYSCYLKKIYLIFIKIYEGFYTFDFWLVFATLCKWKKNQKMKICNYFYNCLWYLLTILFYLHIDFLCFGFTALIFLQTEPIPSLILTPHTLTLIYRNPVLKGLIGLQRPMICFALFLTIYMRKTFDEGSEPESPRTFMNTGSYLYQNVGGKS